VRRTGPWLWVAAVAGFGALASCESRAPSRFDAAIAFHERKLRDDPGLYPVRAELAEVLLDRARVTHDPQDVQRARAELERSIAIQPSFHAFKVMAALCNFTHRFEDALGWAERAREAYPEDTGVTAQRVEALLGLGRAEEAAALLAGLPKKESDFYLTAAEARIHSAGGDVEGSAECFLRAAEIARGEGATSLVLWANVSAAAAYIDAGRAAEAKPYLEAAAGVDPDDPLLRIHQAELMAAQGRERDAVGVYESLLKRYQDPVLHAAASGLERRLGNAGAARRHFQAAEAGYRRVLDAGEVYALESLARLYLEAETNLEEAKALAERNLQFKHDADANELLDAITARLDGGRE
jgi:tetratricopeptide (TPR) repeat protein